MTRSPARGLTPWCLAQTQKSNTCNISTAFCRIPPEYKGAMDTGRDRRMVRVTGVLAFDLDSHTGLGGLRTTPPSAAESARVQLRKSAGLYDEHGDLYAPIRSWCSSCIR
ncbi:hypothetical protein HDV63DRAFT_322492 [Trichoderma sp. SZMC 28014]